MFEEIKNMFGGNSESNERAGQVNRGIEVEDFVGETATPQEQGRGSDAERFQNIRAGVERVIDENNIPATDILGRDEYYSDQLIGLGVLSQKDIQFQGTLESIKRAAKEIAVERADQDFKDKTARKIA